MYTFIIMIGDAYIDIQGFIYIEKRGCRVKPDKIIWCHARKIYDYYIFKKGKLKLIPFEKVHPKFLFWDCRSNLNKDFVHPYNL